MGSTGAAEVAAGAADETVDAGSDGAASDGAAAAEDAAVDGPAAADEAEGVPGVGATQVEVHFCDQEDGLMQVHHWDQLQVAGVHLVTQVHLGGVVAGGDGAGLGFQPTGKLCGGLQDWGRGALGFPPLQIFRPVFQPPHLTESPPSQAG